MKKSLFRTFIILLAVIFVAAFSNRSGKTTLQQKHKKQVSYMQKLKQPFSFFNY